MMVSLMLAAQFDAIPHLLTATDYGPSVTSAAS